MRWLLTDVALITTCGCLNSLLVMLKTPQGQCNSEHQIKRTFERLELPELLTVRQAAELLHIKPCTVRNERLRGKLGFIKIGAKFFYTRQQIADYLARQEVVACVSPHENPSPARSETTG